MMSRRRMFASVAGVAIASSACMAYPNSSWFQTQSPTPEATPVGGAVESAPAVMEAGGYQREEGPRVSIYADIDASSGTRLVRANFHLDDDAYVVVGHIDADGILRIEFPDTPLDNGFTEGRASYQTAQFFAGFTDQYRARFTTGFGFNRGNSYDSYDGGTGYVFIIASWQPLHFEKFSTDGRWDSFELTDADYMRNPRPAVYELASLLAGTNPSTYTVKFASGFDTRLNSYAASDAFYSSDALYGAQMCSGFGYGYTFGFPSSPFSNLSFNPVQTYGYGQPFWWRGTRYVYDPGFDCYHAAGVSALGYGYIPPYVYGWSVAQAPQPQPPTNGRLIGIDRIRPPSLPQSVPMHLAPGSASDVGGATTSASKLTLAPETTPEYRTRGLVVHQDPSAPGVAVPTRSFGGRAHDAGTQASGFQGLVIRGGSQANNHDDSSPRRAPNTRSDASPSSPRAQTQSHNDAPHSAPQSRSDSPRAESARTAPSSASQGARSAPAASSSSSSGGKPPGAKN